MVCLCVAGHRIRLSDLHRRGSGLWPVRDGLQRCVHGPFAQFRFLGFDEDQHLTAGTQRKSGLFVAIKVIDKSRFPGKHERQLRNEAAILQVNPCVVS